MNKLRIAILSSMFAMSAFADMAAEGGLVVNPSSFKGKVSIIDRQRRVAHSEIKAAAAILAEASGCNVVAEIENDATATPSALMGKGKSLVAVVVVDDAVTPAMLIAPEDHWGLVNVNRLVDDLPSDRAKSKFLPTRTRKEIIRAFSLLCGGGSSQFKGNLMNAASLRETDYMKESIPVDMINFWRLHLSTLGVTPKKTASYADACQQGWAPPPTNDVQKAVWKEVHAIPDKPITIEFDPKKDK